MPLATGALAQPHTPPHTSSYGKLCLGALGVVYGDIGTSPLYAIRECFGAFAPTPDHVLGLLSLVFWSLTVIVTINPHSPDEH